MRQTLIGCPDCSGVHVTERGFGLTACETCEGTGLIVGDFEWSCSCNQSDCDHTPVQ